MHADGYSFCADSVAKFYNSIVVRGWFHHQNDRLKSIAITGAPARDTVQAVNLPHRGVEKALGPNRGFTFQTLLSENVFPDEMAIIFESETGWKTTVRLFDLAEEGQAQYATANLSTRFSELVRNHGGRLLDIGGRDRSGLDYSSHYPNNEVTVIDILPGENVHVVGDAHQLSSHFEPETFDAVLSVSVFEHLLIPWKVVLEINKVLKIGGFGLIHTHQSIGMHDAPWDFWRFSDNSWKALFNKNTGFEIVETAMDNLQYLIPFYYSILG
jgi:SAM-dependent methyltransferase